MIYTFLCEHCKNDFERNVPVETRDDLQACEYCGCGAERVFVPTAAILTPESFRVRRADYEQSYHDCKRQEAENDAYLASKPKPKPSFEQILAKELDDHGVRHPHVHQLGG